MSSVKLGGDILRVSQIALNFRYVDGITTSPILQIYQFGNKKAPTEIGAIMDVTNFWIGSKVYCCNIFGALNNQFVYL